MSLKPRGFRLVESVCPDIVPLRSGLSALSLVKIMIVRTPALTHSLLAFLALLGVFSKHTRAKCLLTIFSRAFLCSSSCVTLPCHGPVLKSRPKSLLSKVDLPDAVGPSTMSAGRGSLALPAVLACSSTLSQISHRTMARRFVRARFSRFCTPFPDRPSPYHSLPYHVCVFSSLRAARAAGIALMLLQGYFISAHLYLFASSSFRILVLSASPSTSMLNLSHSRCRAVGYEMNSMRCRLGAQESLHSNIPKCKARSCWTLKLCQLSHQSSSLTIFRFIISASQKHFRPFMSVEM